MINVLYLLIVFPIEQILEICFFYYYTTYRLNFGIAILAVSALVSIITLPIYLMAEKQQQKQRDIEKKLKKGVDLFKSTFKGYERFMLISAHYRQNNYRPVFELRNSLNLLIQIPFFIAAYHFLSNLEALKGASFWFISDLGSPDKLLFGFNLLPIIMTVINLASVMIYSKGLGTKDKAQLYIMAGIFLVLLYNSPAGLALYWTSNNVYSLIKNIIQKVYKYKETKSIAVPAKPIKDNALNDSRTFILALLALTLLIGLVIPSGVISSDIRKFSYLVTGDYASPLRLIIHSILQAGGFFLWGIILFFLFKKKAKAVFTAATVLLLIMSIMNTFVFWGNYGFLTQDFVLSNYYEQELFVQIYAITIITALSAAAYFLLLIKWKLIIMSLLVITVISFAVYGITDIVKINTGFVRIREHGLERQSKYQFDNADKVFNFSRNGKNVILLMLDRAQAQHIPYIFEEKPELLKSFQGFTFYPNMVSYGNQTALSAQTIFGGYYYTPYEMQKRKNQTLKNKFDEGVQVLPRIMASNNYNVVAANHTVFVNATANLNDYDYAAKIFDGLDNIKTVDIIERYRDFSMDMRNDVKIKNYDNVIKKNILQFALFKCAPYAIRSTIYNNGNYMNININRIYWQGYSWPMLMNYLSLLHYPVMTQITDDNSNNCLMAVNELTHEPNLLPYPDYEPVRKVTDRGDGIFADDSHYNVAVLAFLLISRWLDYLKENGIWDNLRIIIASDHGFECKVGQPPGNIDLPDGGKLSRFNSLLMVKDFGAAGEFAVDSTFMTTADVPTIMLKDIIENPVDPFTQKPLYTDKNNGALIPTISWMQWGSHGEYTYNIKDSEWLKVKENIFKEENWTKYSPVR